MRFAAIDSHQAESEVTAQLHSFLSKGKHVLWFVSGGSCVEPQARILHSLPAADIANLTVLLADERFGSPGHANSNYRQLIDAGFSHSELKFADVLAQNHTLAPTAQDYLEAVQLALASSDVVVATLGIGTDGHTAGILPDYLANQGADKLIAAYETPEFVRITIGLPVLNKLQHAWVFAYGEKKQAIVEKLLQKSDDVNQLPAHVFYNIPSVTIYNDTIESEEI